MTTTIIKNGRVIDPSQNMDEQTDVFIEKGTIKEVIPGGNDTLQADREIDAGGCIVAPGLVDIHTHLREPGNEEEETIASGAASAVAGGFTAIAAMPNTEPAIDNEASAEYVVLQAKRRKLAKVHPIGAVTVERKGERMAELAQIARGGAVAFSDDGMPVENDNIMRQALTYARMLEAPIINHAEELSLSANGVMHEGTISTRLGLSGIPAVSEEIMVHRDITLAELTSSHVHIAHVSTKGSVELIREAKEQGIRVTGEVTPHHFSLTDDLVETFDPVYKMKPPLRSQEDVEAMKEGLADGTLDAIATDHAPHSAEEKDVDFPAAPFGVIGMESALPIAIRELIQTNVLSWPELISVMSTKPAEVLNLDQGTLKKGSAADVVVIDPDLEWTIQPEAFESRSENCPYRGWDVEGKPVYVLVDGRLVYEEGKIIGHKLDDQL